MKELADKKNKYQINKQAPKSRSNQSTGFDIGIQASFGDNFTFLRKLNVAILIDFPLI